MENSITCCNKGASKSWTKCRILELFVVSQVQIRCEIFLEGWMLYFCVLVVCFGLKRLGCLTVKQTTYSTDSMRRRMIFLIDVWFIYDLYMICTWLIFGLCMICYVICMWFRYFVHRFRKIDLYASNDKRDVSIKENQQIPLDEALNVHSHEMKWFNFPWAILNTDIAKTVDIGARWKGIASDLMKHMVVLCSWNNKDNKSWARRFGEHEAGNFDADWRLSTSHIQSRHITVRDSPSIGWCTT